MRHEEHREAARSERVRCAVITVSDTCTEEDDRSGQLVRSRLEEAAHEVVCYHLVPDEPECIGRLLDALAASDEVDATLFNGGTAISVPHSRRLPGAARLLNARLARCYAAGGGPADPSGAEAPRLGGAAAGVTAVAFRVSRCAHDAHTMPRASMALPTCRKPAMLAPFT